MNSKLIKSSAAVILAGMMGAGTALAAEDLEVTMDVLGDGEQIGVPVNQVIRLPEPAPVREQTRTQVQDAQGQTRQVREQVRHAYRYSQPGAAQDETYQQREQNREMQEESRQVREEAHEQARELREQAQEEISQMREETTSLREEIRDIRSNGR